MQDNKALYSLLIVDDDPYNRAVILDCLHRLNGAFEIDEAQNGEVALRLVKEKIAKTSKNFDVIIMDYQMPLLNGQATTQQIRKLEESSGMKPADMSFIITWSSAKSTPFIGADAVMSKPLIESELRTLLEMKI